MAARVVVPITALSTTGVDVKIGTGTAIDATNKHYVALTVPLSELVIRVENTTAGAKTFTVVAGDSPPASSQGQGDLVTSVAQGNSTAQVKMVAGLESARFTQDDGTLLIDPEGSMTGFISVYHVPRV
jgi:hypothetical protein